MTSRSLSIFNQGQRTPSMTTNGAMLRMPQRFLNLHEYQSKELMGKHGVSVQSGYAVQSVEDAVEKAKALFQKGAKGMVVKAQIHAGGRGKGYFNNGYQGGVHIAKTVDEVEHIASRMLGAHLITKQTPPEGQLCLTCYLEPTLGFDRELYLAFLMDRNFAGPVMVASTEGGMDIEAVAKKNPDAIIKMGIDIEKGLLPEQSREMAQRLGFAADQIEDAQEQMLALYNMFNELDCTQIEINPLVVSAPTFKPDFDSVSDWVESFPKFSKFAPNFEFTEWDQLLDYTAEDLQELEIPVRASVPLAKIISKFELRMNAGKVYCLDAKLNFDDNAEFRHKEIFALKDKSMEDPRETAAAEYDLNYIALDGNIGCMVNGAGLAMATMDIISLRGGSPANFLDVGGGASEQQVEAAFRILTSDENVKAILVNIFGGIMQCDVIAKGIVSAASNIDIQVPIVVRLEGTNITEGNAILRESGIDIITASDLDQAAQLAVQAIANRNRSRRVQVLSTGSEKITPSTA